MKKISAFLLAVCLIINAFTFMPVSAERVVLYYVNHDFESVEGVKQITVTNIAPDPTKQSQYEILGESYPWRTALYNGSTPSFSYEPNGDSFTGDPQPFHNTTAYIKSSGKNQYPKLTMEMKNPQTGEIEATYGNLGILYIYLIIKRKQQRDQTDIYYMDSAGKTSSILFLPNGGTPSHAPRINGKSTSTGLPTTTTIANSQLTDWWYYRVILDFNTKKQKAFIGETLDTLMPFRSDTSDYDFYDSNAKDFYKVIIGNGNKSAFSFDDFRVFSISGVPMPAATASLSGKIYIGEQLTGTYTYSEPALGEEEGDSIAYWEISIPQHLIHLQN